MSQLASDELSEENCRGWADQVGAKLKAKVDERDREP